MKPWRSIGLEGGGSGGRNGSGCSSVFIEVNVGSHDGCYEYLFKEIFLFK